MDALERVSISIPSSMSIDRDGVLKLAQPLGMGSVLLGEEGTETWKEIDTKAVDRAKQMVSHRDHEMESLNWTHFAAKSSSIDGSLMIPTLVFGKAAFLVRKPGAEGDSVTIFSHKDHPHSVVPITTLGVEQTKVHHPLDLSSGKGAELPPSASLANFMSPLLSSPNLLVPQMSLSPFPFLPHNLFLPTSQNAFRNTPLLNSTPGRRAKEKTMLPCQICGKAFDRPSLLKRHMRTHTGEKPHICEVCNKGFSTSSSLNTHRRIHSGEKPHQCTICGKRFTASSNLYYHRMTHNKDKPHKCTICDKSFPTPGDLKSHQFIHSGVWPFRCHICQRGFNKQNIARNHMLAHLTGLPHVIGGEESSSEETISGNSMAKSLTSEAGRSTPRIQCPVCGQPQDDFAILQIHLRGHLLVGYPGINLTPGLEGSHTQSATSDVDHGGRDKQTSSLAIADETNHSP